MQEILDKDPILTTDLNAGNEKSAKVGELNRQLLQKLEEVQRIYEELEKLGFKRPPAFDELVQSQPPEATPETAGQV